MTIIPINGLNERMGGLFRTPKHLLLVDGVPALKRTVDYMSQLGEVVILAGEKYYGDIKIDWLPENCTVQKVKPTDSVIDTIRQFSVIGLSKDQPVYIVDCDVVPINLNPPNGNTVYCFENTNKLSQYSNYFIKDGVIIDCNEKRFLYSHAGSGVYYFSSIVQFFLMSGGCSSISEVVKGISGFSADLTSDIYRLGTLPDITGGFTGNKLNRTIHKAGPTVESEKIWYKAYEDKADIPEVYENQDLLLQYLECEGDLNVYKIRDIVEKYKNYRPLNILGFESYVARIYTHLLKNNGIDELLGKKLIEKLKEYSLYPTFAHGDLSTTNIIPTKEGHKLIDPLYSIDKFGSYVLDYAKLLFSLKFYNNDIGNFNLLQKMVNVPTVFIASECVRVCSYKKEFNFIAENLIAEL